MEKRIIFHIDVNNAFLSWTAVDLLEKGYGTDIRKIPAIIGGDESRRHGIVLAKSPIAKKYGIVTAETLYSARKKCPSVKIYPPDYKLYYEKSSLFHSYLRNLSPNVEKYSVDEAFVDLTGTKYLYDDYIKLAYKIKDDIKSMYGFTVNVGIANNMLCAKMASNFEKPDRVHTLFMDEVNEKMWPLPIEDLFMVGKSTSAKLRMLGINTIGDLANTDIDILSKHFKNQAGFLKNSANGIDDSKVEAFSSKNPSISVSETLTKDISDKEELKEILFRQTDDVARQLRKRNKYCSVVAIIYKNSEFVSYSKQKKLNNPTDITREIYNNLIDLLNISFRNEPIRLIGVRISDFSDEANQQISLFDEVDIVQKEKEDNMQKLLDEINNKFGNNSIMPASMKKK